MLYFNRKQNPPQKRMRKPVMREKRYALSLNTVVVANVSVLVLPTAWKAMQDLRHYISPRYETYYLLRRKKAFNTLFFQQGYDVLICDRNFRIIALFDAVEPGFISPYFANGYFILFTPKNTINHLDAKLNDHLKLERYLLAI